GISKAKLTASSNQEWNEEEKQLSDQLNAQLSLEEDYFLQILIHPVAHDHKSLGNGKTLYERLITSVRQYLGWSFPCPDFELKELSSQSNYSPIIGSSDRLF